jgi:hypothetical protein
MRIELLFERNTAYPSGFSSVRNITFVQSSSIKVKGRSTADLVRKPLILEAEGFNKLSPFEN